jgi:type II secretory pathway pseudopilin PulG
MKIMKTRVGFTLLEVFVVLIIVGIIVTMVMPSWGKLGLSTTANAAAGVVQADLQRMFSEAQKNKRPVRLVVNLSNRRYSVTDRGTGTIIWTRFLSGPTSEFQVTSLAGTTPTTIDVFPNGFSSNAITFVITIRSETRTVTMSRVGYVRIS